jgi:hypothetical protein
MGGFSMKCDIHRDKEATGYCVECGVGVCDDCTVALAGQTYCHDCVEELVKTKDQKTETNQINIRAGVYGFITALLVLLFSFLSYAILPSLFCGLIAGYVASAEDYTKSMIYGTVTSAISVPISFAILNASYLNNNPFAIYFLRMEFTIELFIIAIILGALGGLMGIYLRQKIEDNY